MRRRQSFRFRRAPFRPYPGERDDDIRVGSAQHSTRRFFHAARSIHVGQPFARVNDPNVGNAEGQIFFDTLLNIFGAIVFRQNLDAEKRRLGQNLAFGLATFHDTNNRPAESGRQNLGSRFGVGEDTPFNLPDSQISANQDLQSAVIELSRSPRHQLAIYILYIWIVSG